MLKRQPTPKSDNNSIACSICCPVSPKPTAKEATDMIIIKSTANKAILIIKPRPVLQAIPSFLLK
jgi:hypothetical protein